MASSKDGKQMRQTAYRLVGAGFEFAAVIAAFVLIGWWLDGKLGTSPWLMVIGLAISFIGGMYKLWRIGKKSFE